MERRQQRPKLKNRLTRVVLWRSLFAAIAALTLLLAACGQTLPKAVTIPQTSLPAPLPTQSAQPPESAQAPPNPPSSLSSSSQSISQDPAGQVQLDRLVTDLKWLEGERHSSRDRAQTLNGLTQVLRSIGWQTEAQTFATGTNLIATWPSSGKSDRQSATHSSSSKLLIGAHYDTVEGSPGADDNATGVAALLEIARVYAGADDLMLVFFDREEQGLEGSLAFATVERVRELRGAIVLEMLGYTCQTAGCQSYPEFLQTRPEGDRADFGEFIAVVGDAEHPELLQAFESSTGLDNPSFAPVFPLSVPLKGILTPDVLRSDHAPFWLRGLGAVMVTDTANLRNPYYHQAGDRVETLDLVFFEQVVKRVVVAIAQLRLI